MVMAKAITLFKIFSRQKYKPNEILFEMNNDLHETNPKGTFITEAFLKQLEREGLLKLPTEKEINKRLEEIRKLEQDQRLAEQKDIKIEDLVETERARADKEGTKDFEQDNYDFEVPTIKPWSFVYE